jgi:hypothetical protein
MRNVAQDAAKDAGSIGRYLGTAVSTTWGIRSVVICAFPMLDLHSLTLWRFGCPPLTW